MTPAGAEALFNAADMLLLFSMKVRSSKRSLQVSRMWAGVDTASAGLQLSELHCYYPTLRCLNVLCETMPTTVESVLR